MGMQTSETLLSSTAAVLRAYLRIRDELVGGQHLPVFEELTIRSWRNLRTELFKCRVAWDAHLPPRLLTHFIPSTCDKQ